MSYDVCHKPTITATARLKVVEREDHRPFDDKRTSSRNSRIGSSSTQRVIQRSDQLAFPDALEKDSLAILEYDIPELLLAPPIEFRFKLESLNLRPLQIVGSEPVPNPYAFLRLIDANASVSEYKHNATEKASCNQDRSEPGWSSGRRQADRHESRHYDHAEDHGGHGLKTIPVYDAHLLDLIIRHSQQRSPSIWFLVSESDQRGKITEYASQGPDKRRLRIRPDSEGRYVDRRPYDAGCLTGLLGRAEHLSGTGAGELRKTCVVERSTGLEQPSASRDYLTPARHRAAGQKPASIAEAKGTL